MRCPHCKNDMHIVSQFFTSEVDDAGQSGIFSIVDFQCVDPQCPNGKKGVPTARESRRVENSAAPSGGLACCGRPLAYVGAEQYWLPDLADSRRDGDTLTVVCPACGSAHSMDVAGKIEAV